MKKNTVTVEKIDEIINNGTLEVQTIGDKTTLVKLETKEGAVIIETSSCVDKDNYDIAVGEELCLKKIKDKLWEYEGYCLQKKIFCPTPRQLTARERVEEELEELCIKHYKIVMFIENNFNFKKLNYVEQDCLLRQEECMKEYIDILKYRLSIWRDTSDRQAN